MHGQQEHHSVGEVPAAYKWMKNGRRLCISHFIIDELDRVNDKNHLPYFYLVEQLNKVKLYIYYSNG